MPNSDVMYDEAIALQQQGQMEEAIGKLQELLAADPNYALAHSALSVFYSRLEQHDQAVEHAQKVCELESNDPFSYVALSLLCQKAGRIPEAERALMMARQVQMQAHQQRMQSGEE
ncbi:MAG: tetratricopeptide repeat protein [Thermoguttaceae bacterium]